MIICPSEISNKDNDKRVTYYCAKPYYLIINSRYICRHFSQHILHCTDFYNERLSRAIFHHELLLRPACDHPLWRRSHDYRDARRYHHRGCSGGRLLQPGRRVDAQWGSRYRFWHQFWYWLWRLVISTENSSYQITNYWEKYHHIDG